MSLIKQSTSTNTTYFVPKFPDKYTGQWPIILRSEWERVFAQWCDMNQSVLKWSSETVEIPYYDPVRRKTRRYYPDFFIKILDKEKKEVLYIIEIKPFKETVPPKKSAKKSQKTKIYEHMTYVTNQAKWKAAIDFCNKKGYEFRVFTEKELFGSR